MADGIGRAPHDPITLQIHEKQPHIEKRAQYLTNTQPDVFDLEKRVDEFGPHIAQPRDNEADSVVRSKTDLLTVTGFRSLTEDTDAVTDADAIWKQNKMPTQTLSATTKLSPSSPCT